MPPVLCHDVVTVLLYDSLVHHIGLHELADSSGSLYLGCYLVAHVSLASEDDDLGTLESEIFCYAAAEYSCAACYDYDVVLDVEKFSHDVLFLFSG